MKSVVHELPDKRVVVVVLRTIITLLVLLATTACLLAFTIVLCKFGYPNKENKEE